MITTREKHWVLGFALVVMGITTLPYLFAYGFQEESWRFSGHLLGVEDGNSYIANMLSGSNGDFLFKTRYSTLPQNGVLIFLPYILLGKLAAPPGMHEQLTFLFHAFRIGAGILAILATYDFIAYFVREVWLRRFGIGLAVVGGGLGWILLLWEESSNTPIPIDFYSPEAFGFLSMLAIPHLALARAFLLWGSLLYLRAYDQTGNAFWKGSVQTGFLWLLATIAQPLTGMLTGTVAGAHLIAVTVWQIIRKSRGNPFDQDAWWRYTRRIVIASLIAGPFYIYNIVSFMTDPFLNAWNAQSNIPSPPIWEYLLAYSLVIPFAITGFFAIKKERSWQSILPVSWVMLSTVLIYAPFSQQRRLIDGVWVVMITLACVGLSWAWQRHSVYQKLLIRAAPILVLTLMPTLLLLTGAFSSARESKPPMYVSTAYVDAITFLDEYANANEIVLSAYPTGSAIPSRTYLKVVIGNTTQSVEFRQLTQYVTAIYGTHLNNDDRLSMLSEINIRYVVWGDEERRLGTWDPRSLSDLTPIYDHEGIMIFEFH